MKLIYSAVLVGASLGVPAAADGAFTVGGFTTNNASPYADSDDDWELLPYLSYDTERVSIGIDGLAYHLINSDQSTLSVGLSSNFGTVFDENVALFDGLKREADLQIILEYDHDFGGLFVEGMTALDVSDAGSGHTTLAAVGYAADIGFAALSVSGGVIYNSEDHNQYHFGIAENEVTSDRSLFLAEDALLPFATLELVVPFSENAAVIGQIEVTDYSELKDSPLIDTDMTKSVVIGVVYQF